MAIYKKTFLSDVAQEVESAKRRFPSTRDQGMVLTEEVGEVIKALLEMKHEPEKGVTHEDIYRECVQVAAMATRLAVEGIPDHPYNPTFGKYPEKEDYAQLQREMEEWNGGLSCSYTHQ